MAFAAFNGTFAIPKSAHRDQQRISTNSEKMSDSVGHLEQEIAACIQSDETRMSTNDDK